MTGLATHAPAAAGAPFFAARGADIGVQLYTLEPDLAADLAGTLGRLAAIGCKTVETAGLLGRTASQLKAALDLAGLRCVSAHVPAKPWTADPALRDDLSTRNRNVPLLSKLGMSRLVLARGGG